MRLSSSLGKSAPGRGNSLCKGPEVMPCLVLSIRKNCSQATKERVGGGEGREVT